METSTHRGFRAMFVEGRLTLGIFAPVEAYQGSIPTMHDHLVRIRRAERLGFAALWVRDVPLYDPSFGDVGQIYDLWVYLGYVARHTRHIALATGSIVLPLRHPLHVAKAAASIDCRAAVSCSAHANLLKVLFQGLTLPIGDRFCNF